MYLIHQIMFIINFNQFLHHIFFWIHTHENGKEGKVILLQARCGPEGGQRYVVC